MGSNRLLDTLSRNNFRRLFSVCEEVELTPGDVLWQPQKQISHVYFPIDCRISQRLPADAQDGVELALVGYEGMLGTPLVLGVKASSMHAVVQGPGVALRLSAAAFGRELQRQPALRRQLNRYTHVLQEQFAQSVACVSRHALALRLARLLLMTHDCVVGAGRFHVTHRVLAQTLGVRREGVTKAAGLLQQRKLLSYSRGDIAIVDRAGLEKASCVCYQTSKGIYARVLG